MDKITITITRGCDSEGNGGAIVDNASAVLGSMPDGTPIVDALVAAFADAYGLHEVDGQPVSGYRNVSYRLRQHMTEIVSSYAQRQTQQQAAEQAGAAVSAALGNVTILDQV